MTDKDLPQGWAVSSVGELADYVNGRAFKPTEWKDSGKPIIRIQNLNDEGAKYNFSSVEHEEKYRVKNGDLLFAWSASLGAHVWHGGDAWLNQHIFNVLPKGCTTKPFVFYLLTKITAELYAKAHGSGMVHVTKGKFETTEIALPPLNEQHRIVAKIEELFSELDKGIENLKTAREQLKVYRQALLKHAFEGKLTAAWRAANPDKLEPAATLLARIQTEREQRYRQQLQQWQTTGGNKPKAPKPLPPLTAAELAELPELPEGWGWVRLASVVTVISGYAFKSGDFVTAGVPVVKIANVGYSEFVDKDQEYLDTSFLQTKKDFLISPNDFLLALTRPITNNRTKVCRYPKDAPRALLNQRVSAMKEVEINPEFLYSYFGTSLFKESIRSKFSETLQPNLSPKDLEACPIPICGFAEQAQIACEIEARLSETDQLDQTLATALQQAEALRQSILKKAFSGQLVAQDANDEPASALLARIGEVLNSTRKLKGKEKQA